MKTFQTTKLTLRKYPESFLVRLCDIEGMLPGEKVSSSHSRKELSRKDVRLKGAYLQALLETWFYPVFLPTFWYFFENQNFTKRVYFLESKLRIGPWWPQSLSVIVLRYKSPKQRLGLSA